MQKDEYEPRHRRRRTLSAAVGLLLLPAVSGLTAVRAQQVSDSAQERQVRLRAELHKMPGRVIAEDRSVNAPGAARVTGYTVEELELPEPLRARIRGRDVDVSRAWRVTLYGGPFPVRAMPATLKIGGKAVIPGVEGPNLDRITFVVLDGSLLRDGDLLTFSYGGAGGVELGRLNLGDDGKGGRQ